MIRGLLRLAAHQDLLARTMSLLRAALLGLVMFLLLGATLLATTWWNVAPPSPGISREPLMADYAVPVRKVAQPAGSAVYYEAKTAFWGLLPNAWRSAADWRLQVDGVGGQEASVSVAGVQVGIRQPVDSTSARFFS